MTDHILGHCVVETSTDNRTAATGVDALETDRQLEQSLQTMCANRHHEAHRKSPRRKHVRTINDSTDEESEPSSDDSGRFDDAEESNYPSRAQSRPPSVHSAKRRRSNEWPLQVADGEAAAIAQDDNDRNDNDTNDNAHEAVSNGGKTGGLRKPFQTAAGRNSPRTSLGSGRFSRQSGSSVRGRRSRFVEGTMSDSVSEKPPSIFLRDDARHSGSGTGQQRGSGIFRFGKAIASAFNPFGVWGWKGNAEANKQPEDPLAQAERAYAELKRSGYKGTVKGSYIRSLDGESGIPPKSWNPIPEPTTYRPLAYHSRQNSGEGIESGGSIRSSFQELRKAKSSLGIPYIKRLDSNKLSSEEQPEGAEVRRQKSRKELQRQAKLMKRVSDLELKLHRARQELRDLVGEEEEAQASTAFLDKPYSRRFVPGALPSLPSERLLHNTSQPTSPISPRAVSTPLISLLEHAQQIEPAEVQQKFTPYKPTHSTPQQQDGRTPRTPKEPPSQSSLTADSPTLKRKSPDPASVKTSQHESDDRRPYHGLNSTPTPRKPKLPKMGPGDSPGSVERKHTATGRSPNTASEERGRRRSTPLRSSPNIPRSPSTTAARRRASNSRTRATLPQPSLRMKKGRPDLRSASAGEGLLLPTANAGDNHDKENQDAQQLQLYSSSTALIKSHDSDEMFITTALTSGEFPTSPSPSSSPSKKRSARYDHIPPVPPLPKNLSATAAKVDRRLAKEMGKKREARDREKAQAQPQQQAQPRPQMQPQSLLGQRLEAVELGKRSGSGGAHSFQWPEDFF
ncbi:putative nuclear RNA binding protein [Aspergillus saccharolyticus JOP 1030-1]|uniref:Nuclear RNA binding protein n=1 Tax=Aspergillus saccharolyticus JOP 1030-1 TaxID=1450539 RepID=A0A318ZPL2_9EURO|nr:hypothetical protein BP01DRAFT_353632 [Aspergillus saccharolyticus JOP 1030-1]PYH48474.1 hypothetical protein BP01DRAFT_353632 [Aspergillus saccharolyticus JOP 1030-1]